MSVDISPYTFEVQDREFARRFMTLVAAWVRIRMGEGAHPDDAMLDARTLLNAYAAVEIDGK